MEFKRNYKSRFFFFFLITDSANKDFLDEVNTVQKLMK